METKICSKCKVEKDVCEFSIRSKTNKPISSCKECEKIRVKEYNQKNLKIVLEKKKEWREKNKNQQNEIHKKWREKNKEYVLEKVKKWNENNKEKRIKYEQEYRKNNLDKIKKYQKNYREKNSSKFNEYAKNKRNTDPIFKLSCNVRNRIREFLLLKNISKKNKTFDLIGVTPLFLKEYLESKFTNNMSWDNYGEWHIDHIIPLSSANTEEEIYELCHYTNLQPLWAKDNLVKSNKLDYLYEIDKPKI